MIELTIKVPEAVAPEIKMLAEKLAKIYINSCDDTLLTLEEQDMCVAKALTELRSANVIRSSRDYAWIMTLMNEQVLEDFEQYFTCLSFIDYLKTIGIEDRPSKSALYDNCATVIGEFPNWEFTDKPEHIETTRRINVGKRFINAYMRAKKAVPEGFLEK